MRAIHRRAPTMHDEVAGHLEHHVANEEQPGAQTIGRFAELQVRQHVELGDADVDAVQVRDHVAEHQEGNEPQRVLWSRFQACWSGVRPGRRVGKRWRSRVVSLECRCWYGVCQSAGDQPGICWISAGYRGSSGTWRLRRRGAASWRVPGSRAASRGTSDPPVAQMTCVALAMEGRIGARRPSPAASPAPRRRRRPRVRPRRPGCPSAPAGSGTARRPTR